jgi:AcrR family transcriptional regulator
VARFSSVVSALVGRPPAHSVDDFIDAAIRLFATGGARAVTMTSVAREVGAPSGSIYHRFADRPTLLSAVWLRTTRGFQHGLREVLESGPPIESAIAACGWTVDWCRDNVEQAIVLHAGARAFSPETWPAEAQEALAAHNAALNSRIRQLARDLAAETGRRSDEVAFALFDLPLAVVRRYLASGDPPPERATSLVTRLARRILAEQG